jgi:hypothetical protein
MLLLILVGHTYPSTRIYSPINLHLFTVWLRSCLNYHCILPWRNQSRTHARQDPALLAHVAMPVSGSSWRPGAATADGGIAPQLLPCCQQIRAASVAVPARLERREVRRFVSTPICMRADLSYRGG